MSPESGGLDRPTPAWGEEGLETPSKVSQGPAPAPSCFYSISIPHLLHTLVLHLVPWAPLFNPGERESARQMISCCCPVQDRVPEVIRAVPNPGGGEGGQTGLTGGPCVPAQAPGALV